MSQYFFMSEKGLRMSTQFQWKGDLTWWSESLFMWQLKALTGAFWFRLMKSYPKIIIFSCVGVLSLRYILVSLVRYPDLTLKSDCGKALDVAATLTCELKSNYIMTVWGRHAACLFQWVLGLTSESDGLYKDFEGLKISQLLWWNCGQTSQCVWRSVETPTPLPPFPNILASSVRSWSEITVWVIFRVIDDILAVLVRSTAGITVWLVSRLTEGSKTPHFHHSLMCFQGCGRPENF